jgi:hypothetical protein
LKINLQASSSGDSEPPRPSPIRRLSRKTGMLKNLSQNREWLSPDGFSWSQRGEKCRQTWCKWVSFLTKPLKNKGELGLNGIFSFSRTTGRHGFPRFSMDIADLLLKQRGFAVEKERKSDRNAIVSPPKPCGSRRLLQMPLAKIVA